jgi:PAS domain S-box-containing protein
MMHKHGSVQSAVYVVTAGGAMPEFLNDLLSANGFMPHGHCYLWRPGLIWLHVISDALIALAYISIPFTLVFIVRKRRDIPFHWMFLCFGVFIIACGLTHAMDVWTLWIPTYWLAGFIKATTAAASVPTAVLLIKLVPHALAIPTPRQLARAHEDLQRAHEALERRVQERTAELTLRNHELANEIAERKRAEDALVLSQAQRDADARFSALLEAAPDAMVIVDHQGRIVLVNAETEKLFGYTREQLLDQPVDLLVPERLRTPHAHHRAAYALHPTGRRIMGAGQQLVGRRSDGGEFPAEIRLGPIPTPDGLLVSSAIRDITDRTHVEQALRVAKTAAEIAYGDLESFSYSVAHDLRAPLRAIHGHTTTVLEDYRDQLPSDAGDRLDRVIAAALRMSNIIDALLSLARLSRTEPRRELVDLTRLAHQTIAQLRATEPTRTVDFIVPDDLIVHGDPSLLRVLLDNLLGNAWKFTGKQPAARIELGCEHTDDTTTYFVRDNGAGFDMSFADKLFTPFKRLHTPTEFPGNGIGLATVHRIVRRHGGRIWAESVEAHGATFHFTLPADARPRSTFQTLPPDLR